MSKKLMAGLRRRMLKAFPNERLELMWGHKIKGGFQIDHFHGVPQIASKGEVIYSHDDVEDSKECAKEEGLMFLGSIHSHPGFIDAAPSEEDHILSVADGDIITGIVGIHAKGRKRRWVRVRFSAPLVVVKPELI